MSAITCYIPKNGGKGGNSKSIGLQSKKEIKNNDNGSGLN